MTDDDTVNIDSDRDNADWSKRTWDLPNNLDDLRALLKRNRITVKQFKRLPVYQWNVGKISWLKDL